MANTSYKENECIQKSMPIEIKTLSYHLEALQTVTNRTAQKNIKVVKEHRENECQIVWDSIF